MENYTKLSLANPQQCIASRILKCNRIINSIFRKHLKHYGVTNSQLGILFFLSKAGSKTQQELSNVLYLEKSTISRNMKRMFDKSYLVKSEDKKIGITEKGKGFLEQIIPAWETAMQEARNQLTEIGEEALTILLTQLTNQ